MSSIHTCFHSLHLFLKSAVLPPGTLQHLFYNLIIYELNSFTNESAVKKYGKKLDLNEIEEWYIFH